MLFVRFKLTYIIHTVHVIVIAMAVVDVLLWLFRLSVIFTWQ